MFEINILNSNVRILLKVLERLEIIYQEFIVWRLIRMVMNICDAVTGKVNE